jgi:fimbrial chaperone protein
MLVRQIFQFVKVSYIASAGFLSLSLTASAMSVVPVSSEISSSGPDNKITLRVINDSATPTPVEIVASQINLSESGEITSIPVKGRFLIYPPQATIAPGTTQSFRVQWLGDANIKSTESYILGINQLPIQMDKSKSGVQMVFNFSSVVNVSPPNAKPAISVVNASIGKTGSIARAHVVTIQNTGNGHAMIGEASVTLSDGKWTKTLSKDERQAIFGLGLVQPKSKRRFVMSTPLPDNVGKYEVRIELKSSKPAR